MTELRFLSICGSIIISILVFQCVESSENPIDFGTPPMWLHPCKSGTVDESPKSEYQKASKIEEAKLYDAIFNVTQTALRNIEKLKDKWADVEFKDFYLYKQNVLWGIFIPSGFLPKPQQTRKILDGPSPVFEYDQRNELFPKFYEWFQKIALGMEQLVHDEFLNDDQFRNDFLQSYKDLQMVLCEIQIAMFELGIDGNDNIDRSLMTEDERVLPIRLNRSLRDFTIVREYCNILQYLDYVMLKLKEIAPLPVFQETNTPSPANKPPRFYWGTRY